MLSSNDSRGYVAVTGLPGGMLDVHTLWCSEVDNVSIGLEHVDLLDRLDGLHVDLLKSGLELLVVHHRVLWLRLDLTSRGTLSAIIPQLSASIHQFLPPLMPPPHRLCLVRLSEVDGSRFGNLLTLQRCVSRVSVRSEQLSSLVKAGYSVHLRVRVLLTNAHRLLHLLQLFHIHDGGCVGGGLREKDDCRATR